MESAGDGLGSAFSSFFGGLLSSLVGLLSLLSSLGRSSCLGGETVTCLENEVFLKMHTFTSLTRFYDE